MRALAEERRSVRLNGEALCVSAERRIIDQRELAELALGDPLLLNQAAYCARRYIAERGSSVALRDE